MKLTVHEETCQAFMTRPVGTKALDQGKVQRIAIPSYAEIGGEQIFVYKHERSARRACRRWLKKHHERLDDFPLDGWTLTIVDDPDLLGLRSARADHPDDGPLFFAFQP